MRGFIILSMGLLTILCTACPYSYTFEQKCGSGCQVQCLDYYRASNTDWARNENAVTFDLGIFAGGTSMVIGTCGIPGAHATGKTYLRLESLYETGETIVVHGEARDCARATDSPNWGDSIWHITPRRTSLTLKAGCVGDGACSGRICMYAMLDANGEVFDVPSAFDAIRDHGRPCGVSQGHSGWFRDAADPQHFQGIQRLRSTLDSGYDNILHFYDGGASCVMAFSSNRHLWFARVTMEWIRPAILPLGSNLCSDLQPCSGHEFLTRFSQVDIGTPYDHMGGFQVCGHVLFIGATGGGNSEIIAMDISRASAGLGPAEGSPSVLYTIDRQGRRASAVGVTHRRHGTWGYLMAVCHGREVDFYFKDHDLNNFATIRENEVIPWRLIRSDIPFGESYEGCNLVTGQDGTIYLIGMLRRVLSWSSWRGDDYMVLYRIDRLCPECVDPDDIISLTKVDEKHMICSASGESWCTFKAAPGVYVNPGAGRGDENRLLIYSGHYRDRRIEGHTFAPFMEFNTGAR